VKLLIKCESIMCVCACVCVYNLHCVGFCSLLLGVSGAEIQHTERKQKKIKTYVFTVY
jgi:hypothetical protein